MKEKIAKGKIVLKKNLDHFLIRLIPFLFPISYFLFSIFYFPFP